MIESAKKCELNDLARSYEEEDASETLHVRQKIGTSSERPSTTSNTKNKPNQNFLTTLFADGL